MKNTLNVLCLLIAFLLSAKSYSQVITNTDDWTVTFTSQKTVQVKNKRNCKLRFRIRLGAFDTELRIAPNGAYTYTHPVNFIPGTSAEEKTTGSCGSGGNGGWITITVPALGTLAVQVLSFEAEKRSDRIVLRFQLDFSEIGEFAVLEKSTDNETWKPLRYITAETETEYTDAGIKPQNFYRLKLVQAEKTTYCKTVSVSYPQDDSGYVHLISYSGYFSQRIKESVVKEKLSLLPKGVYVLVKNGRGTLIPNR